MPFKSEKQRRYLWANEPEIARDWTDTYGSRIQKKNGGITQAGVINYLPSKEVTVPVEAKSSPDHVKAHLAYITDAEQDLLIKKNLHGSLKGKPNRGPGGIPSLQGDFGEGWDSYKGGQSGTGTSGSRPSPANNPWADAWSGGDVQTSPTYKAPDPANEVVPGDVTYTGDNPWATAWDDGPEFKKDWGPDPETEKKKIEKWESEQDWKSQKKPSSITTPLNIGWQLVKDLSAKHNAWARKRFMERYMKKNPMGILPPTISQNMRFSPDFDWENWTAEDWKSPEAKEMLKEIGYLSWMPDVQPSDPDGHYGGVPGAVPFGDMPLWQQQGFNSYEDWLATQGGGTTGGGTTGGTTTTQVANTVVPFDKYGTVGYEDIIAKQFGPPSWARGGRVPAAFGGIMDTKTGRRGYFLGSIKKAVKGVAKAAGKVLRSDWGKAALGIGAFMYGPKLFGAEKLGGFGGWGQAIPEKGFMAKLFRENVAKKGEPFLGGALSPWKSLATLSPFLAFTDLAKAPKQETLTGGSGGGKLVDPLTGQESIPGGMRQTLNDALTDAWDEEKQAYDAAKMATIKQAYPFLGQYPTFQVAKDGGRIGYSGGGYSPGARWSYLIDKFNNNKPMTEDEIKELENLEITYADESKEMAQGGRIGAQEGGLMNLGGMEKDYRNNGGFVAIGGEERADDVPARLSRNEFVFTADAVRGAGGGDIDKGAEIMENVMKNLEQGGKISEETQGNTGAQEMFSVSERIGEVL